MYGGELIYQTKDKYGSIEVVDHQQAIRSLHFGNKTQQSAMLLANPYVLIHKYAQAMLLPTCFIKLKNVLILGLGAGSLVKHLYNYFPDVNIVAVELREKVIELASEYFLLPDTDDRFSLFNQSASEWLLNHESTTKYDLIIVDMFLTSESAKDICIDPKDHIAIIHNLLSENGIATFNHLGNNVYSYSSYHDISSAFSHNLFSIDIESTNTILLASRGLIRSECSREYLDNLEKDYVLPYTNYFNKLIRV